MQELTKKEIRDAMRVRRRELTADWVYQSSCRIQQAVMELAEWTRAVSMCGYLATRGEVDTSMILKAAWQYGKTVWMPAYRPEREAYEFGVFSADDAIGLGPEQVPEPQNPQWLVMGKMDFAVVPGVAFDAEGRRLGHGGGHYDRLLSAPALAGAFKVGVAFDFQICAKLPIEPHDMGMDAVVTETAVYRRVV